MGKRGKSLGQELVLAYKAGEITEPITTKTLYELRVLKNRDWADNYLDVFLANSASVTHSHTYKKYVESIGDGEYVIAEEYR